MKWQLKLSAVIIAAFAGFAALSVHAQLTGKYLAPRDQVIAVRAGRLFDARSGTMLASQVVLVRGDRIADINEIPFRLEIADFDFVLAIAELRTQSARHERLRSAGTNEIERAGDHYFDSCFHAERE